MTNLSPNPGHFFNEIKRPGIGRFPQKMPFAKK